jgi:hypothetical protein
LPDVISTPSLFALEDLAARVFGVSGDALFSLPETAGFSAALLVFLEALFNCMQLF